MYCTLYTENEENSSRLCKVVTSSSNYLSEARAPQVLTTTFLSLWLSKFLSILIF